MSEGAQIKCRVLLVDDQEIVFESLKLMLQGEEGIECFFCPLSENALQMAIDIRPTIILQDLIMPGIDGLMMVRLFRKSAATKEIPLVVLSAREESKVKAEAFQLGANDYLVKLPGKEEMVARIRYHSRAYLHEVALKETMEKLQESREELLKELREAADYVYSRLPAPLHGVVETEWTFLPSAELGGDGFGYFWVDLEHFAIYLIDVCGHGVGAALLSAQVLSAISDQTVKGVNYLSPASLFSGLNRAFPMDQHNQMFFTIWYGVLDVKMGDLIYSVGGHPPPLLLRREGEIVTVKRLPGEGLLVGGIPEMSWSEERIPLSPGDRLLIFSDGAFERLTREGVRVGYPEFLEKVLTLQQVGKTSMTERLGALALSESRDERLADDCSLLLLTYHGPKDGRKDL